MIVHVVGVRLSCILEFGDLDDAYKLVNLSNLQWVEMRIGGPGIKTKGILLTAGFFARSITAYCSISQSRASSNKPYFKRMRL